MPSSSLLKLRLELTSRSTASCHVTLIYLFESEKWFGSCKWKHPRAGNATRGCQSFKYTAVGPESNSRLQFDRFNFSDESLVAGSYATND
jgi:hypothetical protein